MEPGDYLCVSEDANRECLSHTLTMSWLLMNFAHACLTDMVKVQVISNKRQGYIVHKNTARNINLERKNHLGDRTIPLPDMKPPDTKAPYPLGQFISRLFSF